MEQFIPYEKRSKKQKAEINRQKRKAWQMNPVTKRPPNPKAYNRKKQNKRYEPFDSASFFMPERV